MSLANPSRIESMSGERQGWLSGCPWPLDRIDRPQPVLARPETGIKEVDEGHLARQLHAL
jgi:hypothetical protein